METHCRVCWSGSRHHPLKLAKESRGAGPDSWSMHNAGLVELRGIEPLTSAVRLREMEELFVVFPAFSAAQVMFRGRNRTFLRCSCDTFLERMNDID